MYLQYLKREDATNETKNNLVKTLNISFVCVNLKHKYCTTANKRRFLNNTKTIKYE